MTARVHAEEKIGDLLVVNFHINFFTALLRSIFFLIKLYWNERFTACSTEEEVVVVVGESPAVFHDIMIEKGVVLKVQLGGWKYVQYVCGTDCCGYLANMDGWAGGFCG